MDENKPVVNGVCLDQLAMVAARGLTSVFERAAGVQLWQNGVGDLVAAAVAESALPKAPVTAVDLARHLGILNPAPRPAAPARPRRARARGGA